MTQNSPPFPNNIPFFTHQSSSLPKPWQPLICLPALWAHLFQKVIEVEPFNTEPFWKVIEVEPYSMELFQTASFFRGMH